MSVRGDASADALSYSTVANLPSAATHSWCGWVKLKADRNDFQCLWYLNGNNADGEIFMSTSNDGTTLELTDSATALILGTLPIDAWRFIAYQRTNTGRAAYIGSEAGGALTKVSNTETKNRNTAYGSSAGIQLFNDIYSEWANAELALVRVWTSVALSDAEIDAEYRSPTPVRTSGLWADYRLVAAATATTDSSGNARTLTAGGTFTDGGTNPVPPALASAARQLLLLGVG